MPLYRIKLFAGVRDAVGAEEVSVEAADDLTVAELRQVLQARYPQAAGLLARSFVAVDHAFAVESRTLSPDDEIAIIPPVSGG